MKYFAYGSNMSMNIMSEWCTHHELLGPARLNGYRLGFTYESERWGGGAADILEDKNGAVWGVLYEVDDSDLQRLDEKESVPTAYGRKTVTVNSDSKDLEAIAYAVIPAQRSETTAAAGYLEIIIAAARRRGLPQEYVEFLESFRGK